MAVFRPPNHDDQEPLSGADSFEEPALESIPEETNLGQNEQVALNQRQELFGDKPISRDQQHVPTNEKLFLQKSPSSPAGSRGSKSNPLKLSAAAKKRLLAAGSLFALPTAIGIILFLIGLQAGFTLEHIKRISTGVRFGSMHLLLSRRFNHIRREYVRTTRYQTTTSNQFARYTKTTLGSRLLGVTPDNIYTNLNKQGYTFKYKTFGGSKTTLGRKTLVEVGYPSGEGDTKGRVVEIRNSQDAQAFLRDIGGSFDDQEVSRFRAMRSSHLLAKQIGIPFLRFRTIIDGFRDGSFKNLIRGSPAAFVKQRIDEEIVAGKRRISARMTRLQKNLKRFDLDELADSASKAEHLRSGGLANLTALLQESLNGRQAAFAVASAGSLTVGVVTLACVIRELGVMLRDAIPMKIRGLQDNAATVLTTTSQIRAGYAIKEVVSDMTQRFNGFALSANYQLAINSPNASSYVGRAGSDFSGKYSPQTAFGGFRAKTLATMSQALSPAAMEGKFRNYLAQAADRSLGFFGKAFSSILSLVGKSASAFTAGYLESQFAAACNLALNSVVQIGLLVVEVIATVLLAIFSGGIGAAGRVGAGQALKEVTKAISRSVLLGIAGGVALDILLFDYLLPGIVANATGAETALLSDPDNPAQGAENYASVDYGMHYLKEGEALNMGGSRISLQANLTQTQEFLALDRQSWQRRGWLDNLINLQNPYSVAASLAASRHSGFNWQQKGLRYTGNLLGRLKDDLQIRQAKNVAAVNRATYLSVMYPGQTHVIGFQEAEMRGQKEGFQHAENTVYVEDNLQNLYDQYSACLGLDASGFLMSDIGIISNSSGRNYYPDNCDNRQARRYKTYYQDCLLIDGLQRWGTNTSPMFSSQCDHLLPQVSQDTLRESVSDIDEAEDIKNFEALSEDFVLVPREQDEPEPISSPPTFSLFYFLKISNLRRV